MFIYVYYELFASINLLDVMPLFFTVLSFYLSIFGKIHLIFGKFARKSSRRILEKITDLSVKSVDKSPKPAEFRYSRFLLFLHRLQCVSVEFFRISPIFSEFSKKPTELLRSMFSPSAQFSNFQTLLPSSLRVTTSRELVYTTTPQNWWITSGFSSVTTPWL
jgi:hypothetical protein